MFFAFFQDYYIDMFVISEKSMHKIYAVSLRPILPSSSWNWFECYCWRFVAIAFTVSSFMLHLNFFLYTVVGFFFAISHRLYIYMHWVRGCRVFCGYMVIWWCKDENRQINILCIYAYIHTYVHVSICTVSNFEPACTYRCTNACIFSYLASLACTFH